MLIVTQLKKNTKIIQCQNIVILQNANEEDDSPSLGCVRCSKIEIFFEIFRANLQSLVWRRHVGVLPVVHQYGG